MLFHDVEGGLDLDREPHEISIVISAARSSLRGLVGLIRDADYKRPGGMIVRVRVLRPGEKVLSPL